MQTVEELIQQAEGFFKEKKYQEIVDLLPDELLQLCNDGRLYAWRGRGHNRLNEKDKVFAYVDKAIQLSPTFPLAYTGRASFWLTNKEYKKAVEDCNKAIELDDKYVEGYYGRALALFEDNELDRAITDFNKALEIDKNYVSALNGRGNAWRFKKEYDKAIADYNNALEIDKNYVSAINGRGIAWFEKKEFDKAIADYNKAMALENNNSKTYNNRGIVWSEKKEYDKAIVDYNKAIELDDFAYLAYNNRGNAWLNKKEYESAINDYNKAIEIDVNSPLAYYNRGLVYKRCNEFNKAIVDFEKYLLYAKDKSDFWANNAKANINELKQSLRYSHEYQIKLNDIKEITEKIKQLLIFEEDCITHYTSLTAARILILDKEKKAKFRLSEGAFMNDPSEGKILFNFLKFKTSQESEGQTITDIFTEKPFLGSFVSQTKHDDLTLWRMYGKEAMQEAKGTALTLNRKELIDSIKKDIKDEDPTNTLSFIDEFTFYRVAYIKHDGKEYSFIIPDASKNVESKLKKIMIELKEKIALFKGDEKIEIAKVLNNIMYHFKSVDYYYEHEVRLIISGNGFKKIIETNVDKPKVSIELTSIVPALHKITLGPKVERAEEWAATFHYHIKEHYDNKVEIVISHLPFK